MIEITPPTTDAVIVAGADGLITFADSQAHALFGYDEMIGLPLVFLMPVEYREAHLRSFGRYMETGEGTLIGKTVSLQGLKKDGTIFLLSLSLYAGADKHVVAFIGDKSPVELVYG